MSLLPESLERYRKFISFLLKYRNSDIMKQASDAMLNANEDKNALEQFDKEPMELVEDLKNMGPTYIKMGQLLSTRPDMLPDNYLEALATLQDDVAPIPYEEVHEIVEQEIGARISKAFQSFDKEPLASASIGQVHKAVLLTGQEVAVKVQRPGVRKQFLDDLDTIKDMVNLAVKHSQTARRYALDDVLEELRYILLQELDYTKEAQNLLQLGQNLKDFEYLIVPKPIMDYSSSKVLTMDFMKGIKITSLSAMRLVDNDFTPQVDDLVKGYLKQIVVDGFAHADPHPGNVHLTEDNKIALMDLGMVARFSDEMKDQLLRLLIAISQKDGAGMAEVLLKISEWDEDADLPAFKKEVSRMILATPYNTAENMETGKLIVQMNRAAAEKGIRISVEINILGKILLNMDQIVAKLTPKYNLQEAIREYVEGMMQQRMKSKLKPENLYATLVETKKLTENLPERLNKISEALANNEFKIKIEALNEQRLTEGFQKVANRITVGLIISAMIVGAALLMKVPTTFSIFGYPGLAMLLFLLSAVVAFFLVFNILSKDEDFKRKKRK